MSRTFGHVISIVADFDGDALKTALAVGAATLTVGETADFDEDGGSLIVANTVLGYTKVDDLTGIVTLGATSTVSAPVDHPVTIYDPETNSAVVDYLAMVKLDESKDGDALPASISQGLLDRIGGTGIAALRGKAVALEYDPVNGLTVVDTIGSDLSLDAPQSLHWNREEYTLTGAAPWDHTLSAQPASGSILVFRNGVMLPESGWGRAGLVLTVNATASATGDRINVRYAYLPDDINLVGITPPPPRR